MKTYLHELTEVQRARKEGKLSGPWCAACGLRQLRGEEPAPCNVRWCQGRKTTTNMTTTNLLVEYIGEEDLPDGTPVLILQPNGDKLACSPLVDADGTLVLVPDYPADEVDDRLARDAVRRTTRNSSRPR